MLVGDFTGEGAVSIFDFPLFTYWFGEQVPTAPAYADLNNDLGISIFDFPLFSDNFGIGLTVLTAVAGVQGNLRHEIGESLPQDAPAFFFIDIQPDQIGPFREIAAATEGVQEIESVPSLRGRITHIDGVPVAERGSLYGATHS